MQKNSNSTIVFIKPCVKDMELMKKWGFAAEMIRSRKPVIMQ